jgi:hypothetical protein
MRCVKFNILLVVVCFFFANASMAQSNRVSGKVVDTTGAAIAEANILLIVGADTLKRVSDKQGRFDFKGIKAKEISLNISMMGYRPYLGSFVLSAKTTDLSPISLKASGTLLKEVLIKGKPNPVRIMKDTIEFDASAYALMEDDRVSDLLKRLPGVAVDDDDNVKTLGKEMVRLRVNGKDFFTNNVQEFIGKLPANIVAKIQIIDNYGDQANFTGIRTGEPEKMLNIVTKPGMNKGTFGSIGLNGGTNDQIGLQGSVNIWNDDHQSGANANATHANNGAGKSKNESLSANYRDTFKNKVTSGINYYLTHNNNDTRNISFIETLNPLGTLYNQTANTGNNNTNGHNLNWDVQKTSDRNFLNLALGAAFQQSKYVGNYTAKQSGIINQDLINQNSGTNSSPNVNLSGSWSKRFTDKRRSLSVNFAFNAGNRKSDQSIISNTLYYDTTLTLIKDLLLDRLVESRNKNISSSFSVNYNHPLKQPKDTLASRSLGISYQLAIGNSDNTLLTYVKEVSNTFNLVDSLSNLYQSQTTGQMAGVNYNYNSARINFNFGANVRPNKLIGNYKHLQQKIRNATVNYSPNFALSRTLSKAKTLALRYNGNNANPSQNQLQPVRNTQNLQNVIIGNPNLKPSFTHNVNMSYNYIHLKSGSSFQASLNGSSTQNQIVSNVILVRDTLNSLKQETRYTNANGGYNLNANYTLSLPFAKNKYTVNMNGNLGHSNAVSFADNIKYLNKGIQFSQSLITSINTKKFSANANATYSFVNNDFSLFGAKEKQIQVWNFGLSSRATVFKTYRISVNASKRINSGYVLQNTNPTLIGAGLSKVFFKKRSLSFNAQAFDLLNQGNNLNRNIVGNSVIDTQSNQITRYVTFGLSYNLQKFDGIK